MDLLCHCLKSHSHIGQVVLPSAGRSLHFFLPGLGLGALGCFTGGGIWSFICECGSLGLPLEVCHSHVWPAYITSCMHGIRLSPTYLCIMACCRTQNELTALCYTT